MKIVCAAPIAVFAAYVADDVLFGGKNTIIVVRMAQSACAVFGFYF